MMCSKCKGPTKLQRALEDEVLLAWQRGEQVRSVIHKLRMRLNQLLARAWQT